jgi:hypothetical protein
MNKIKNNIFLIALVISIPALANSFITYKMKSGESISEILFNQFQIGTPGNPRLYGKKGFVNEIFKLNNLDQNEAKYLKTGFELKLPSNLQSLIQDKNLQDEPIQFESTKEIIETNQQPSQTSEEETLANWKWHRPHLDLLGGTYFSNESTASNSTTPATLSRNLQPILGTEIDLRWGLENYYWQAATRLIFTKNMDSEPKIPLEFSLQERISYPGLRILHIIPYFDITYERFYFNQPSVGSLKLTKSQGIWGGLGLNLPVYFGDNYLNFYFSYLQSINNNAEGNNQSFDLSGSQMHYWARYKGKSSFFIELHGQHYKSHSSIFDLTSTKFYSLLGYEF